MCACVCVCGGTWGWRLSKRDMGSSGWALQGALAGRRRRTGGSGVGFGWACAGRALPCAWRLPLTRPRRPPQLAALSPRLRAHPYTHPAPSPQLVVGRVPCRCARQRPGACRGERAAWSELRHLERHQLDHQQGGCLLCVSSCSLVAGPRLGQHMDRRRLDCRPCTACLGAPARRELLFWLASRAAQGWLVQPPATPRCALTSCPLLPPLPPCSSRRATSAALPSPARRGLGGGGPRSSGATVTTTCWPL